MSVDSIPVLSLFCGCGGMDLGFKHEGIVPILALDSSPAALDTYNANDVRNIARTIDLSEANSDEIVKLARSVAPGTRLRGVIGGPPCQSFSVSNVYRKRRDPRADLPLRYAEILTVLNREFVLDFFVFENVLGLKSHKHKSKWRRFLKLFEAAGFNIFERELNAQAFGVPQDRERLFIVGINKLLYPNVKFEFPKGEADKNLTVRSAIDGLPQPIFFKRGIRRDDIPHHPNHWTMVPKSPKFTNGSTKSGRSFRKLRWDRPSWTVAYGHREIHVHPNGTRRVSILEAMLLQGFPKEYELRGNLSEQVEQISNAVPPPLAGAIAKTLRSTIYDRVETLQKNLLQWFEESHRSFPWRNTRDPYKILLAEKLLQQTAANEQVVTAYNALLRAYPTVQALSRGRLTDIQKIITPLGFSYRAKEITKLAQMIMKSHGGKIPKTLDELRALPGIGDYIARAVLSFAFGQDVAVVDTNISRLLHRVHGLKTPAPTNPARSKLLAIIATQILPKGSSREFNLAALDLCASICTPRRPNCLQCPIQNQCEFRHVSLTAANGIKDQPRLAVY